MEKAIQEVKKLADFQMRKSQHIQFLEGCIADSVVPKGLKLTLSLHIGDNNKAQEIVDRILHKTSLEICRIVRDEHQSQLFNSKGKMTDLERKLKTEVRDERKFNEIADQIFKQTEAKKNQIENRQNKKLQHLKSERDSDVVFIRQERPKLNNNNKPLRNHMQTRSPRFNGNHSINKGKGRNKFQNNQQRFNSKTNNGQATNNDKYEQDPKNFKPQGTVTKTLTYAEAARRGNNKQKEMNTNNHQNKQTETNTHKQQETLQESIAKLISCLQNIQGTGDLLGQQTRRYGRNGRNYRNN